MTFWRDHLDTCLARAAFQVELCPDRIAATIERIQHHTGLTKELESATDEAVVWTIFLDLYFAYEIFEIVPRARFGPIRSPARSRSKPPSSLSLTKRA